MIQGESPSFASFLVYCFDSSGILQIQFTKVAFKGALNISPMHLVKLVSRGDHLYVPVGKLFIQKFLELWS